MGGFPPCPLAAKKRGFNLSNYLFPTHTKGRMKPSAFRPMPWYIVEGICRTLESGVLPVIVCKHLQSSGLGQSVYRVQLTAIPIDDDNGIRKRKVVFPDLRMGATRIGALILKGLAVSVRIPLLKDEFFQRRVRLCST